MQKTTKILSVVCGLFLLLASADVAQAKIDISSMGNGAGSDIKVRFNRISKTRINQSNNADVVNKINISSNTGGNTSSKNTGGDQKVDTGNIDNTVVVDNAVNVNDLVLVGCDDCDDHDSTITVDGNGANSDTDIKVEEKDDLRFTQDNDADVKTKIDVDADTGDNKANKNTNGDSEIDSGDIDVDLGVGNAVNVNEADMVTCDDCEDGDTDITSSDNGSNSDVDVDVDIEMNTRETQDNEGELDNEVEGELDSGNNVARKLTGGSSSIMTGKVSVLYELINGLNFNIFNR